MRIFAPGTGFFRSGEAALDATLIRLRPRAAGRGDPTCGNRRACDRKLTY
jgi:hypothetical protein